MNKYQGINFFLEEKCTLPITIISDTESDYKDESKMSFDKESSLMVDLLLDESEYDDDTSVKLHEYVTGEALKPSQTPPHYNMYDITAATQNGTVEIAQGSMM